MPFDSADFAPAKIDPKTITDPKERLKYLADFLRGLPAERLKMDTFFSGGNIDLPAGARAQECGTAACVAGWTVVLFRPTYSIDGLTDELAMRLLGLTSAEAERLFYPKGWLDLDFAPAEAADAVAAYLATGEVDWSKAGA
jgi:hypothetical protein